MKKRLHILLVVFMLGFFMPMATYACGTKSEKSCCKKDTSDKKVTKECCKGKDSKDTDNRCNGKCGHSNCTSASSVNFSILAIYDLDFKNNSFDFSTEQSNYYYSKTFISSGFYSIWLIPKIG